jgi:hypothetical protein
MEMRRAAIVLLAACGRLDFGDACVWSAFTTPQPLPGPIQVQAPSDSWMPTPARGGLELYFYSYRPGSSNGGIWWASRPSLADPFSAPVLLAELYTPAEQRSPTVTDDSLDVMFTRVIDKPPGLRGEIFEATRQSLDSMFSPPVAVATIDSDAADTDAFLSADGLRLVFASSRIGPEQHGLDLFETARADRDSPFSAPVPLAELNSDFDEVTPTLSADGLDIYFSSFRPGGIGGADIYTSSRPAIGQPFAPPHLLRELSSARDDACLRLAIDGATMYQNYDAVWVGGAGASLDAATRSCD